MPKNALVVGATSGIGGCKPKPAEFVQLNQSEVSENLFDRVFVWKMIPTWFVVQLFNLE